jgi:hypothetical protein
LNNNIENLELTEKGMHHKLHYLHREINSLGQFEKEDFVKRLNTKTD